MRFPLFDYNEEQRKRRQVAAARRSSLVNKQLEPNVSLEQIDHNNTTDTEKEDTSSGVHSLTQYRETYLSPLSASTVLVLATISISFSPADSDDSEIQSTPSATAPTTERSGSSCSVETEAGRGFIRSATHDCRDQGLV
ncbi:hypothetical protein ACOMHN_021003 [Nucella lapillus]